MVLLTVFCLAIMLVSAVPIGSIDPGDYNPILDINHDGIINMKDLGSEARAFNTNGDPTVPVNVTNLPLDEQGNLKTSEQRTMTNYTDALMTNIFDVSLMISSSEFGAYTSSVRIPFVFSPKQTFLRITKVMIATSAFIGPPAPGFNFMNYQWQFNDSNGIVIASGHLEMYESYPTYGIVNITDTNILNMIMPGLNLLYFNCSPNYIFLLKANVYVEYQYQA